MPRLRKPDIYLALSGLLLAIAVHWWNGAMSDLPFGHHQTADDPSYLRPAENWIELGAWKDNTDGRSAYIQRPPGMGIIHLPFFLLLGKWAFVAEMMLFFLLHALAIYCLPTIFRRFLNERSTIVLSSIYLILPCFWGFLSYTITESITPSLIILLLASTLQPDRVSRTVFLFFVVWMIRPLLILLLPIVIYQLWKTRNESRSNTRNVVVLTVCLLVALFWEARKIAVLDKEGYTLHPIYSETNATPFRPVHAAFSDLFRLWEVHPERFHAIMGSCWTGDTTAQRQLLDDYYEHLNVPVSKQTLLLLLNEYSKANTEVHLRIEDLQPRRMMRETWAERQLRAKILLLTKEVTARHKARSYLHTPFKSAVFLLSKSQLNLELFQRFYRNSWWVTCLRFACLIVILLAAFGTFLSLFSREKILRWLAIGFLTYLFYLCYAQRMNEDRYLIPALPILLITGGIWWTRFTHFVRQKLSKKS